MRTRLKDRKVVVIDDDPSNCALIQEALVREGCTVAIAHTGQDGITKIDAMDPDLVLLDQDMPGLSGIETLRLMRARQNYVAVIFISANNSPQMVAEALDWGADDYIRKPFSLNEMVSRIAVRFRIKDLNDDLKILNERFQEMAQRDDLTGLYNMRSMYERIDKELRRARRFKHQVSCIMMDMDHFKSVNDGHDHLFGSFVLREVGLMIHQTLREVDFAARYGGDEFLMVLIETEKKGTQVFAEKIRSMIEKKTFIDRNDSISLTTSLGYAIAPADDNTEVDARALVRVADHALYEAKVGGRNRVIGFDSVEISSKVKTDRKKSVA